MKKIKMAGVMLAMGLLAACTDPGEATRAAEAYGFTNVQTTGFRWTGCGSDDDQATGFTAYNAQGRYVSGVVCSNWSPFGKSSTVRID